MVSTARAKVPAAGPRPIVATKKIAHTKSGTVRKNVTNDRAAPAIHACGVVLCAASNARGMEPMIPSTVPTRAICAVTKV